MTVNECKTCGQTRIWHENNDTRHTFNDGSVPFKTTFGVRNRRTDGKSPENGSEGAERPAWPFDPVLRQALIDKGVLTPEDLKAAEAKILVVTGQFQQAIRDELGKDEVWSATQEERRGSSIATDKTSTER